MSSRPTKLPSLGKMKGLNPQVQKFLNAVKGTIEVREGHAGQAEDRFVSYRELQSYLLGDEAVVVRVQSTITAAGILAKLKTVDGSGSGLDADLLDGNESTDFFNMPIDGGTF